MPGMNSGLNPADPTIVSAFRSALMHQGAIVGAILLLLLGWGATRGWSTAGAPEPVKRCGTSSDKNLGCCALL